MQAILYLYRGQKLQKRAAVIDVGHGLVLFVILLLTGDFVGHAVELLGDHLRPFDPIELDLRVRVLLYGQPPRALLQTVIDESVEFVLVAAQQHSAVKFFEGGGGGGPIFEDQIDDLPLGAPVDFALFHEV